MLAEKSEGEMIHHRLLYQLCERVRLVTDEFDRTNAPVEHGKKLRALFESDGTIEGSSRRNGRQQPVIDILEYRSGFVAGW